MQTTAPTGMPVEENLLITKRDGTKEPYNIDKIHRICEWAVEGLAEVFVSEIEMKLNLVLNEGITSEDIHDSLIEAASDLMSEKAPNYGKVAARLLLYKLRKTVWGGKTPPTFLDTIRANVDGGYYDPELLAEYSEREINKLGEHINHDRDDMFDFGGLTQTMAKYLVQNRKTKQIVETPQFAYMLIAMAVHMYEKDPKSRIRLVKRYYDELSRFKVNAPTPLLVGARTKTRSWSSCCLISVEDTKQSLFATNTTAGLATCDRYGIGIDLGRIRPVNSPIRNGESLHSGVIPWLKMYQETIAACQQGGSRRGAGTITFPIFHPEIMTILELKNNQGTHENRVPHMDYSIGMSMLFYKRFVKREDITLFSSTDAPEVYDLWGLPGFDEAYEAAEKAGKGYATLPAAELYNKFFKERYETGRIYCINVDQANAYSPWTTQVTMSNLCQEILHPIKPERFTGDPDAEIGCCILSAINMLNVRGEGEHQRACEAAVRALDNMIDIQTYPVPALENFAKKKRSLGVGVTNLAAWLASQGLNHDSPEAPQVINDFMERQQYYLMQASMHLAKERGPAEHWEQSKYAKMSYLDNYNTKVDELLETPHSLDWKTLTAEIQEHGMRNMTVSAQMPCQSSSVVQNSTNGVEIVNSLMVRKSSLTTTTPQCVPGVTKWKNYYLKRGDVTNNDGIIRVNAVVQKWLCMSGSWNLYYKSENEDGSVSLAQFAKDHLTATKYGLKTFYYCNPPKKRDTTAALEDSQAAEEEEEQGCAGGACSL